MLTLLIILHLMICYTTANAIPLCKEYTATKEARVDEFWDLCKFKNGEYATENRVYSTDKNQPCESPRKVYSKIYYPVMRAVTESKFTENENGKVVYKIYCCYKRQWYK